MLYKYSIDLQFFIFLEILHIQFITHDYDTLSE